MFKGRRVGTFTAGLVLIAFGLLFLSRIVFPPLNYSVILSLWPVILVLIGIEVIVSYIINKEEKIRYDGWSIVLIIILAFFAMSMGGAEFIIDHLHDHNGIIKIS